MDNQELTPDYTNFEQNQRYKELLDEEYQKRHKSEYELVITAQRRYFIELLQEKDAQIAKWQNATHDLQHAEMGARIRENDANQINESLTATIAERDDQLEKSNVLLTACKEANEIAFKQLYEANATIYNIKSIGKKWSDVQIDHFVRMKRYSAPPTLYWKEGMKYMRGQFMLQFIGKGKR